METLEIDAELLKDLITTADIFEPQEGFLYVEDRMTGEWRWGVERRAIIKDDSGKYWAIDYRESVGDEYYNSIDDEDSTVELYSVMPQEATIITYVRTSSDF